MKKIADARIQFWILLAASVGAGGVVKAVGAFERLTRLETQVADLYKTVEAMERREERVRP